MVNVEENRRIGILDNTPETKEEYLHCCDLCFWNNEEKNDEFLYCEFHETFVFIDNSCNNWELSEDLL